MFVATGLAGCANTCFVAAFNNGTGSVAVKAGNPPPPCSLPPANGAVRLIVLKSPTCETCTAAVRLEHVLVTLRSIQLRSSATDKADTEDWLEISPWSAAEPRQIDLLGYSMPETLMESAIVRAESYHEIRLEFFPESHAKPEKLPTQNVCGENRWNCIIMADGHVEPLHMPDDASDLRIAIQSAESNSLVVLPEARMDLQLSLEPQQVFYFSSTEGWKLRNILMGHATVVRQRPPQAENP
jgi:Domain of unknown function (DUF4382)